jgi:hypothetical protein
MLEESKAYGKNRRNVGRVLANREVSQESKGCEDSRRSAVGTGPGNRKFRRNESETSEEWTAKTGRLSWGISVEL